MNWKLPSLGLICIMLYSAMFIAQEQQRIQQEPHISPAIPTKILNIIGHTYLTQLIAEMLYTKVAVYYGGLKTEPNPKDLETMGQHFIAMSELHPKMIDIYYRAESTLAHHSKHFVLIANRILETGRKSLPYEVALPFSEGFNDLNYLNQPLKAAEILKIASDIPNSPVWIGHLASILMAREGNIRSGLALLQGMYTNSQNPEEKERYKKDIQAFKKALLVQQALNHYMHDHQKSANSLNQLIPNHIKALPSFKQNFYLEYKSPTLSLLRRSK